MQQENISSSENKFQYIEDHIHELRRECLQEIGSVKDDREEAYLRATINVLEALEKSFHEFSDDKSHIYPKKGGQPWD